MYVVWVAPGGPRESSKRTSAKLADGWEGLQGRQGYQTSDFQSPIKAKSHAVTPWYSCTLVFVLCASVQFGRCP